MSDDIIALLYGLCAAYLQLCQKVVIGTSGSIEKRQGAGKVMIQAFESERFKRSSAVLPASKMRSTWLSIVKATTLLKNETYCLGRWSFTYQKNSGNGL